MNQTQRFSGRTGTRARGRAVRFVIELCKCCITCSIISCEEMSLGRSYLILSMGYARITLISTGFANLA